MSAASLQFLLAAGALLVGATSQQTSSAFVSRTMWPDSAGPLMVDVDGDGIREVVSGGMLLTQGQGVTLSWRKLLGNGAWAQGPSFHSSGPLLLIHTPLVAGDFNGDGLQDIFVSRSNGTGGATAAYPDLLWLGTGQGGFTEGVGHLPGQATNLWSLPGQSAAAVDIDGDGDTDLVLMGGSAGVGRLFLYINDGTGHFTDETAARIPGYNAYGPMRLAVLDADWDGDLDLFVVNYSHGSEPTILHENVGTGHFQPWNQGMVGPATDVFRLDANGDGHDDVLVMYYTSQIVFLSATGQRIMTQAPQLLPNQGVNTPGSANAAIDLEGDGDLDVFSRVGTAYRLWENAGFGFVDISPRVPTLPALGNFFPFVADFDLDGDDDMFLGPAVGGSTQVVLSSTQREAVTFMPPARGSSYSVEFYAQPNHLMFVALSLAPANFPVPGIGRSFLDPYLSAYLGVLLLPTGAPQLMTVTLPNLPWIAGLPIGMQGIDMDLASGSLRTTNCPYLTIP